MIPTCPTIPMPDFSVYNEVDLVVAQLLCRRPEAGWNRDMILLQVHLVAASLTVNNVRRNENGAVMIVFTSRCEPMKDIFRCDDLKKKDGTWWMYEVDALRMEEKMRSSPGTCELIMPLRDEGNISFIYVLPNS
jgi:xylan alpha-glucuronosyltransferase